MNQNSTRSDGLVANELRKAAPSRNCSCLQETALAGGSLVIHPIAGFLAPGSFTQRAAFFCRPIFCTEQNINHWGTIDLFFILSFTYSGCW